MLFCHSFYTETHATRVSRKCIPKLCVESVDTRLNSMADQSLHTGGDIHKFVRCYRLDLLIGCGSFAEVYKATNIETKEVLALKCFRQQMKTTTHYHAAAREIAFMRIFNHPNILPLKVFEINKRFVFIGTEFAESGSLRTFLENRSPLTEAVIQGVMRQIISGLDYMHSMGIFHGDIKPHNVLCTDMNGKGGAPVVKICDFGLTEIKLKGCDMTYKCGSFFYMAPEVHFRHPVDVTCDLWSAGVVMYYMMFRRSFFNITEKDNEKHLGLLRRRVTPNYNGSEKFSKNCNNLVRGLLSYDKQNRPHGAALRGHPFLNLEEPKPFGDMFLTNARAHINSAFINSQNKKYGFALVEGIQAVLELQIHHNLLEDDDTQRYFRRKWMQYEKFTVSQERALVFVPDIELEYPEEQLSDADFRKHLMSTPKLLDGFDIGCNAEMFLMEGNREKALNMFHQALQILLPLMKTEPKSNRKEILGRRLKRWIQKVECLTNLHDSQETDRDICVGIANLPNISEHPYE